MAQQWYDNKELFEMITALTKDLGELRGELTLTRQIVAKYNGLRGNLDHALQRIDTMEKQKEGRYQAGEMIQKWGGWIIAVLLAAKEFGVF